MGADLRFCLKTSQDIYNQTKVVCENVFVRIFVRIRDIRGLNQRGEQYDNHLPGRHSQE